MIKFEAPHLTGRENIETLLDSAFGGDRRNKTSYGYRRNLPQCDYLAMVARDGGDLVGSIQYWPIRIGTQAVPALLLGPLGVCPSRRGEGIGVLLMKFSLARARAIGHRRVLLVGDAPYYLQFGFRAAEDYKLSMPGEPHRLMALALAAGAFDNVQGDILQAQPLAPGG